MKQGTTTVPHLTIGIDLGDRYSELCVLDADARVQERRRFPTTRPGLAKALATFPPARVVLEVGTHSPWVSRWLAGQGHEVLVANARQVRSIAESSRKSDGADAEQLARLGRADPKLLYPIRHRGESAQRDRALLAVRDHLVRARARLVVQARGLTKALGMRLPSCTTAAFARRVREHGCVDAFPGLAALVAVVEQLSEQIRTLEAQIAELSRSDYPETASLRAVPGVGPITALAYVLTLENPRHFRRSRTVGAYLGLRPRQRDSGDARPQLSITKEGDRYLRWLLVEGCHYVLQRGPDCDLKRFGQRLARRGGKAARKKALVAMARKQAVVLHHLWSTGEAYDPFYTTRRHEALAA